MAAGQFHHHRLGQPGAPGQPDPVQQRREATVLRDALGPGLRFGDAAALKFGEPQLFLVRPEVRRLRRGQPRDLEIHAQLVEFPVAFGQLPLKGALRLGRGGLQRRYLGREIGDGLLRATIRCLDGPRAQVFEFREIVTLHGTVTQKVHVVGPDGRPVTAYYPMSRLPDGSWRIEGCYLQAPDEHQA